MRGVRAPVCFEVEGGDGERICSPVGDADRGVDRFDWGEPIVAAVSGDGASVDLVKYTTFANEPPTSTATWETGSM
jgi:hypothetical protein